MSDLVATTVWSCLYLGMAVTVVFPAFAWFGYRHHDSIGVMSALVSAVICYVGAATALVLTGVFRGPQTAVQGLLLGMLVRMGLPLGAGIVLQSAGGPLAEAGVMGMIAVYYLFTLAVESVLSLRLVKTTRLIGEAS